MVSQTLLSQASRRTGARTLLVEAPIEVIASRHRAGQTLTEITTYLHAQLGADNPCAARCFVSWVVAATERGEA